ncbi:BTB/POZ domain-containing protein 17 [Trichogramma pretiosum]|uniref:BTB/POZ domain-containing protein 17 n=1 Tax=Trichogramma pretiosum TaxID=7493 RepID=UPI0006C9D5DB|nr:BTB/POZ domain-containing protein 17 [Trichogramma pretiosum]XP_014225380.1 BTB/POZ domain-containing protein 17 [Trichogramma pretiosum]XP_014225383.1 BTB/POZ domain-containing protein 17 [Trichogramma pretiosum]XP_023317937.1 BTB/POZ domain-containing protein 17 [Trichogramma pretiosum]XP_023317938.1 BTB/POZ domain-containing protein 17 [Trichogramma pretiosum]XP_023317939.1 BTB/POZ domain-containing protein 17 [Trichogramma pretiosum]
MDDQRSNESAPRSKEVSPGNSSYKSENSIVEVDNSGSVLMKIATLYADRLLNDISLVVNNVEYPAHRLILCASSDVFETMLLNPQWSESQASKVKLQETPQCSEIFGEFLRYFYTGQIRISHNVVLSVLLLADKYNVKDLIDLCLNFMRQHIALSAVNGMLVSWLQYTSNCGHYEVAKICNNFVKWNFELISNTADFEYFELDSLIPLLHQSNIVIKDEMTLYKCLEKWINLQILRVQESSSSTIYDSTINQIVEMIILSVRFPMMSPRQLADLLLSPLTQKYKEFFIDRMSIAMSFHSGQDNRVQELLKVDDKNLELFEPRLYTIDTCSSLLTVENFHNMLSYQTRTLVFSSYSYLAECVGEKPCEWVVDLYPKGVWFKKFFLIIWQGTVEMPEHVIRTVRLSLTCKEPPEDKNVDLRVKIGILIYGTQDGVEHIACVKEVIHRFNQNERVLNLDDILPFGELNPSQDSKDKDKTFSKFLVGINKDVFKLHIVVTPLNPYK